MTYENIVSLIASVGFPIAMCLIMVYVVVSMNKTHKEEMDSLTKALENNTQALTILTEKVNTIIK